MLEITSTAVDFGVSTGSKNFYYSVAYVEIQLFRGPISMVGESRRLSCYNGGR
jgi:hypothetical protein